jgi:pyruvate dehydrogenase E1 component alpha subunit
MLGANGIVGGGIAIALGAGMARKLRGGDGVAVSFFGDGALAQGVLHESLNIAALKEVPVLFVCENNGWSEFSPTSTQVSFTLEKLAAAYAIPYRGRDGTEVEAVSALAADAIAEVRRTRRPMVLEFFTTRVRGHYEGDAQRYRDDPAPPVDPLVVTRGRLTESGVPASTLDALEAAARAEVLAAVEGARASAEPTLESAAAGVYAEAAR